MPDRRIASALVVHGSASIAAVMAKVLARAGIDRVRLVGDCASAGPPPDEPEIVLIDVHERARAGLAFTAFARNRRSRGSLIGVVAASPGRNPRHARADHDCDFLLTIPFSTADLEAAIGAAGGPQPLPADCSAPDEAREMFII